MTDGRTIYRVSGMREIEETVIAPGRPMLAGWHESPGAAVADYVDKAQREADYAKSALLFAKGKALAARLWLLEVIKGDARES